MFFILILIVLLSVNGQDDSKFNVKHIENYSSTKGLFLPWLKVCTDNANQIDPSLLVQLLYKTDEKIKNCRFMKEADRYFLCRGEMSNGIKILGTVSNYNCFQQIFNKYNFYFLVQNTSTILRGFYCKQ